MRVPYCHITKPTAAVGRYIPAPENQTPAPVYEFVKGPHTSKAVNTTPVTEHTCTSPSLDDLSSGQPVKQTPTPGPHTETATPEQSNGIHTTLECDIPTDVREDEQLVHEETEDTLFAKEDRESADGQVTPISSMNRNALIGECKARGIKFGYNDRKVDLIEKIHAYTP